MNIARRLKDEEEKYSEYFKKQISIYGNEQAFMDHVFDEID